MGTKVVLVGYTTYATILCNTVFSKGVEAEVADDVAAALLAETTEAGDAVFEAVETASATPATEGKRKVVVGKRAAEPVKEESPVVEDPVDPPSENTVTL